MTETVPRGGLVVIGKRELAPGQTFTYPSAREVPQLGVTAYDNSSRAALNQRAQLEAQRPSPAGLAPSAARARGTALCGSRLPSSRASASRSPAHLHPAACRFAAAASPSARARSFLFGEIRAVARTPLTLLAARLLCHPPLPNRELPFAICYLPLAIGAARDRPQIVFPFAIAATGTLAPMGITPGNLNKCGSASAVRRAGPRPFLNHAAARRRPSDHSGH